MPVMDGIALALAAAVTIRFAILLMTGFADQRERASGLDALIHEVITKPSRSPPSAPPSAPRWREAAWGALT